MPQGDGRAAGKILAPLICLPMSMVYEQADAVFVSTDRVRRDFCSDLKLGTSSPRMYISLSQALKL